MAGLWGLDYPGYYDPTFDEEPKTPFPGVAPVVTRRVQRDGRYDAGLDMGNGRGCAPNSVQLGYGAGGRLGVDPGLPLGVNEEPDDFNVPTPAAKRAQRDRHEAEVVMMARPFPKRRK